VRQSGKEGEEEGIGGRDWREGGRTLAAGEALVVAFLVGAAYKGGRKRSVSMSFVSFSFSFICVYFFGLESVDLNLLSRPPSLPSSLPTFLLALVLVTLGLVVLALGYQGREGRREGGRGW